MLPQSAEVKCVRFAHHVLVRSASFAKCLLQVEKFTLVWSEGGSILKNCCHLTAAHWHFISVQLYFASFCCHPLCIDSRDHKTATKAASLRAVCTALQECPAWTASDSCFEYILHILRAVAPLFIVCTVFSWEIVWRQVERNFINPEIQAVSEGQWQLRGLF